MENSGESDALPAETVLSELASAEEVSISEMSTNELWALRKMEAYTLPRLIKAGPDKIPSTEESVNEYLDNQAEKLILDDGKVYYLKVYNTLDECQESDDDIFIEIKDGEVDFSGYVSINSYHRIGDGEKFLANYIYSA